MELSGYTFTNKYMAVLLEALDGLMGTNGIHALLNAAGLKDWVSSPPGRDDERSIDFIQIAALTRALMDLYGDKGSQSLMRPASKILYDELWASDPRLSVPGDTEYHALDPLPRIEQGAQQFAKLLNEISDVGAQVAAHEAGVHVTLDRCPFCWGDGGQKACCAMFFGLLMRAVQEFSGGTDFSLEESMCVCTDDKHCVFNIKLSS